MTDSAIENDPNFSRLMDEIRTRRLIELRAIPAKEVGRVNLHVPLVVATVLAVAPKVRALRSEICRVTREVNLDWVDGLEEYALVLNDAHCDLLSTPKLRGAVSGVAEARTLRRILTKSLQILVDRGVLRRSALPKLRGSNGHNAIATDLAVLARLLDGNAELVCSLGVLGKAELEKARSLGQFLMRGQERRTRRGMTLDAARDIRAHAFTALMRACAEARSAVLFARRREGDADKIIPALFAVRFKRKRTAAGPLLGDEH